MSVTLIRTIKVCLTVFIALQFNTILSQSDEVIVYKINGDSVKAEFCKECKFSKHAVFLKTNGQISEYKADDVARLYWLKYKKTHYSLKTAAMQHFEFCERLMSFREISVYGWNGDETYFSYEMHKIPKEINEYQFFKTPFDARGKAKLFVKDELIEMKFLKCYTNFLEIIKNHSESKFDYIELLKVMVEYDLMCGFYADKKQR